MSDVWQALRLLDSKDAVVRARASRRIADLGAACRPATGELVGLLDHESSALVDHVMIALRRIGVDAVPRLVDRLDGAPSRLRVNLLCVLGSIAEPFDRIMSIMTTTLADPDPDVRMQSARSLVGIYLDVPESNRSSHDWASLEVAVSLLQNSRTDPATSRHCFALNPDVVACVGHARIGQQNAEAVSQKGEHFVKRERKVVPIARLGARDGGAAWPRVGGGSRVRRGRLLLGCTESPAQRRRPRPAWGCSTRRPVG